MQIENVKITIIESVFNFEVKKGHLKWSVNQVAQAAKISRSLVYYYFGKTKKDIVIGCLETIAQEFYGLTEERRNLSKKSIVDSLEISNLMYKKNVSYAIFYQKWRHQPSIFRDMYLEFEKRYDDKLKAQFPRATLAQREALQGFFHGLVTAPYLERSSLEAAVKLLRLEDLKPGP